MVHIRRKASSGLRKASQGWHLVRHAAVNRGFCPICDRRVWFAEREGPWLRDSYRCLSCRSKPRHRALITAIREEVGDLSGLRVFEPATHGPATAFIRDRAAEYVGSHYYPDVERGVMHNGHRVEDLEKLTFPDASIDLVVSQDVFEHVMRPDLAFAEIARVLRPGGRHIFTVPIWPIPETVIRVRPTPDGGVEHLLPVMYHGDPVSDGALVITDWSADITDFIERHTGMPSRIWLKRDRKLGLDGEHLEVVVSRKP